MRILAVWITVIAAGLGFVLLVMQSGTLGRPGLIAIWALTIFVLIRGVTLQALLLATTGTAAMSAAVTIPAVAGLAGQERDLGTLALAALALTGWVFLDGPEGHPLETAGFAAAAAMAGTALIGGGIAWDVALFSAAFVGLVLWIARPSAPAPEMAGLAFGTTALAATLMI